MLPIMRTLASSSDRDAISARISALTSSDCRLWGKMSAHQMVCHLCDSYKVALGERDVSPATGFLQRTVVKCIALRAPMKWPKSTPTPPEVAQRDAETAPLEFEPDRAALLSVVRRFCDVAGDITILHPFFERMSSWEWLRWGYLHADHHFRQSGR